MCLGDLQCKVDSAMCFLVTFLVPGSFSKWNSLSEV